MILNIVVWLVVGAIAGWLAGYILTKNTALNIADVIVGIIGAVLGGWISGLLFKTDMNLFSIWGLVMAVIGALIVAFLYRKFFGKAAN